jgi:hypothetical protein
LARVHCRRSTNSHQSGKGQNGKKVSTTFIMN